MQKVLDLNEVFVQHRPSLVKRARFLLGDSDLAEDIVQDAFLYIATRDNKFQNEEDVVSALYWKVRYLSIDHGRKQANLPKEVELDWMAEASAMWFDDYDLGRDDGKEIVALALAKLSDVQRTALVLTAIEEVSQQQAARELEISHAAVRQLLRRARVSFRDNLEAELKNRGWRKSDLLKFLAAPSVLLALAIPTVALTGAPNSVQSTQLSTQFLGNSPRDTGAGLANTELGSRGAKEVEEGESKSSIGSPNPVEGPGAQIVLNLDTDAVSSGSVGLAESTSQDVVEFVAEDSPEAEFLLSMETQRFQQTVIRELPAIALKFDQEQLEGFWNESAQLEIPIGESLVFFIELDQSRPSGQVEIGKSWGMLRLEGGLVGFAGATNAQQWSPSTTPIQSEDAGTSGSLHYVSRDLVFGEVSQSMIGTALDGIQLGRNTIQVRLEAASDGQITSLELNFS